MKGFIKWLALAGLVGCLAGSILLAGLAVWLILDPGKLLGVVYWVLLAGLFLVSLGLGMAAIIGLSRIGWKEK